MNAYELADYITENSYIGTVTMEDVATMLRQQQNEIERLIGAEPITYGMLTVCKNCGQQNPYAVKELTDEKITEIAKEIFKDYKNFHHYQIDFARAVIKEVSGK